MHKNSIYKNGLENKINTNTKIIGERACNVCTVLECVFVYVVRLAERQKYERKIEKHSTCTVKTFKLK